MVEHIIDDLNKEVWGFWYDDRSKTLYLDKYLIMYRESKRHSWKVSKKYYRVIERDNSINLKDVPLTDEIKEQALKEHIKDIVVKKWNKN